MSSVSYVMPCSHLPSKSLLSSAVLLIYLTLYGNSTIKEYIQSICKVCLHVTSSSPYLSKSPSKLNFLTMAMDTLLGKMDCMPILSITVSVKKDQLYSSQKL